MTEHIRITLDNGVLEITFARADKKNALTEAMYTALGDALEAGCLLQNGAAVELAADSDQECAPK